MKTPQPQLPQRIIFPPALRHAEGLCAVLDDFDSLFLHLRHDFFHFSHLAEKMHRHEDFGARRDFIQRLLRVDVVAFPGQCRKDRRRAETSDGADCGKNVNGVVITSSPGFTSRAIR